MSVRIQTSQIQRVISNGASKILVQRTPRTSMLVTTRGPQGLRGAEGPDAEDPGDLTLLFENRLI